MENRIFQYFTILKYIFLYNNNLNFYLEDTPGWVRTSDVFTDTDYESGAFDHSATDAYFGAGGI